MEIDDTIAQHVLEHAPCYVYDRQEIVARCRELKAALPGVELLFSVKANPFEPVVATVVGEGLGVDAASAAEVLLARRLGVPPARILYSAPGKTDADLDTVWGECVLVADSLTELTRIDRRAAAAGTVAHVGLRVNPAFGIDSQEVEDKKEKEGRTVQPSHFGIDESALEELPSETLTHVVISGLHVHVRSQVLDTEALTRYHANCVALAERLAARPGVALRFVNVGSGFGIAYARTRQHPLDLTRLAQSTAALAARVCNTLGATLYAETGRFVVCAVGTFYTPVVDRKTSAGRTLLVVASALAGFLRPAIAALLCRASAPHGAPSCGFEPLFTCPDECSLSLVRRHHSNTCKEDDEENDQWETVDVVGNLCTALDVLQEGVHLPHAEVGDVIAVSNAGAYGYTLSPLGFSSHTHPGQYMWPP